MTKIVNDPDLKLYELLQLGIKPEYLCLDVIKVLAPLIKNPNTLDEYGHAPIHHAAYKVQLEVIRFLAPMTGENPNAPDRYGCTPIHYAAINGRLDVIRFLAPLSENPNTPNGDGNTPIDLATRNGYNEIVQFLQSYM